MYIHAHIHEINQIINVYVCTCTLPLFVIHSPVNSTIFQLTEMRYFYYWITSIPHRSVKHHAQRECDYNSQLEKGINNCKNN